jgi:hypothetical protein
VVTIPADSTFDFTNGTVIAVQRLNTGSLTITGATGVTVNGTSAGSVAIAARWGTVTLTKATDNVWYVSGAI